MTAQAPATGEIEGRIVVRIGGATPRTVEYAVKGDKVRLTVLRAAVRTEGVLDAVFDARAERVTLIDPEKREYTTIDADELTGAAERGTRTAFTRTGHLDTVAGRTCENWRLEEAGQTVEACVVPRAPKVNAAALEQIAGVNVPGWVAALVSSGAVPLRLTLIERGRAIVSAEMARGESVDDSFFETPAGFKKTPGLGVR